MLTESNIVFMLLLVPTEKSDSWSLMSSLNVLLPSPGKAYGVCPATMEGVCVNALNEDSLELWVVQFCCCEFEGGACVNVCHIVPILVVET